MHAYLTKFSKLTAKHVHLLPLAAAERYVYYLEVGHKSLRRYLVQRYLN